MQTKYKARFSMWRERWKILIALFFLGVAITALSNPNDRGVVLPMLVIFGVVILWIIIDFLRYKLVLTDTFLKGTESIGLFGKDVSLPVKQISVVEVSQKGMGKIFNYGTVKVTTASGFVAFKYIKNPREAETAILQVM